MFEKLYSIKLPMDAARQSLYIKGDLLDIKDDSVNLKKNQTIDFATYFNLFSAQKWQTYTFISDVRIQLHIRGNYKITVYEVSQQQKRELYSETGHDDYQKDISLQSCQANFITFAITALEDGVQFFKGAYYGQFEDAHDTNIGIIICTFKREDYVKRNLKTLQELMKENPHFHVMVIDNGRTLPETRNEQLRVIHNRNYGGSGGFTRGLMEQVNQGTNNYVLMMDDDILIETSSLERVYALCRHIKSQYAQQMIAGSMMSMDEPTIQYENTAYWGKVRLHSLGQGFDLTTAEDLIRNDRLPIMKNKYAAWWFCCIPIIMVKKNGYPLPNFIKGDDMEYGIRNHQDIITMNGIGVWHEAFDKKMSPVVNYYSDRNMLILNEFADGCGRGTVFFSMIARLGRRILRGDTVGIRIFELAVHDYMSGYEGITSIGADDKMEQVKAYKGRKNISASVFFTTIQILKIFLNYRTLHERYIQFRNNQLQSQNFWKEYLKLNK